MSCELEDVWSEPVEENPRLRARREAVAAEARRLRLRWITAGLIVLGAIVLLGTMGGLAGSLYVYLFGTWFW
jgi:hypothetical protein